MTKEVDEVKKNFLKKTIGMKKEGIMKIIKSFSPALTTYTEFEELLDKEFSLVFTVKNLNLCRDHEAFLTLYQENSQPFSLTASLLSHAA